MVDEVCAKNPGVRRQDARAGVLRRYLGSKLAQAHHDRCKDMRGSDATLDRDDYAFNLVDRCVGLKDRRYVVLDDCFDAAAVNAEARRLDDTGVLTQTVQALADTRDDRIVWLTPDKCEDLGCPALAKLARTQRGFAAALNDQDWPETLTNSESSMLSCYSSGGRYRFHCDNTLDPVTKKPMNARALTTIFYANPDWTDDDGGHLRFCLRHDARSTRDKDDEATIDIAPKGGRCVIFDSFYGHEVLPAHRPRFALTFWIFADRE